MVSWFKYVIVFCLFSVFSVFCVFVCFCVCCFCVCVFFAGLFVFVFLHPHPPCASESMDTQNQIGQDDIRRFRCLEGEKHYPARIFAHLFLSLRIEKQMAGSKSANEFFFVLFFAIFFNFFYFFGKVLPFCVCKKIAFFACCFLHRDLQGSTLHTARPPQPPGPGPAQDLHLLPPGLPLRLRRLPPGVLPLHRQRRQRRRPCRPPPAAARAARPGPRGGTQCGAPRSGHGSQLRSALVTQVTTPSL